MAACGSLQHIFEKPLPESSSLLESLSSWNQINSLKSIDQSSFTELFGELRFKENSLSSSSPDSNFSKQYTRNSINGESFSPRKSESLQLCTEGLGFESFDDVEDLKNEDRKQNQDERISINLRNSIPVPEYQGRKLRSGRGGGGFPPPISCIGKSGKPWVSFKSYRHDGRFVLKQVKMPSQEFLHAHRENGRLKLHFIQPTDETLEEEDEEDEDDDEENCTEEEYEKGENEEVTRCSNKSS